MIARYLQDGTPVIDFAATELVARAKTAATLTFAIKDCHKAIDANPHGVKAGYYADEIHIYAGELQRRRGLAAACGQCGGWTLWGGMSQHADCTCKPHGAACKA